MSKEEYLRKCEFREKRYKTYGFASYSIEINNDNELEWIVEFLNKRHFINKIYVTRGFNYLKNGIFKHITSLKVNHPISQIELDEYLKTNECAKKVYFYKVFFNLDHDVLSRILNNLLKLDYYSVSDLTKFLIENIYDGTHMQENVIKWVCENKRLLDNYFQRLDYAQYGGTYSLNLLLLNLPNLIAVSIWENWVSILNFLPQSVEFFTLNYITTEESKNFNKKIIKEGFKIKELNIFSITDEFEVDTTALKFLERLNIPSTHYDIFYDFIKNSKTLSSLKIFGALTLKQMEKSISLNLNYFECEICNENYNLISKMAYVYKQGTTIANIKGVNIIQIINEKSPIDFYDRVSHYDIYFNYHFNT